MKTKPIIFNAEMVKAILDGRKTQTRRVIKPQPEFYGDDCFYTWKNFDPTDDIEKLLLEFTPFGELGDYLWVREKFQYYEEHDVYKFFDGTMMFNSIGVLGATFDKDEKPWKPSIFMPKKVCRIFLKITDIRVERVQDVRTREIYKEGCPIYSLEETIKKSYLDELLNIPKAKRAMAMRLMPVDAYIQRPTAKEWFADLWNSLNEKRGFGWDINPWVWAIEFERIK